MNTMMMCNLFGMSPPSLTIVGTRSQRSQVFYSLQLHTSSFSVIARFKELERLMCNSRGERIITIA